MNAFTNPNSLEEDDLPCANAVTKCPSRHWIEIELLDEDGVGIANEEYLIVTPDEEKHRGVTDADGLVRLDGIVKGQCKVTFPNLDKEAWCAA